MSKAGVKVGGKFRVWCFGALSGGAGLKWYDEAKNLVPKDGLHLLGDLAFAAQADPTYSVGLTAGSPVPDADDLMSSHAGWTEVVGYAEAVRQLWDADRTNETFSNSAAKATFSVNATVTSGGAFVTTNDVKGGTTGQLLCVAAFSQGNKALVSGDVLLVQYDFNLADDGV